MEREVTEFLTGRGFGADEIAAAEREGRLTSLFTDRLVGDATLSISEVAARTGQSVELVARVWRAAGFPDPAPDAPVFTEADAEALGVFGLAIGFFGAEPTIHLVRVMGTSLSRIAEPEDSAGFTYDRATSPTAISSRRSRHRWSSTRRSRSRSASRAGAMTSARPSCRAPSPTSRRSLPTRRLHATGGW